MTDKILLGTFTNKEKLNDFYERLEKSYSLKKENTFIFSINDSDNLMVTFKLNSVLKIQVFCAWSSFKISACTVPLT